MLKHGQQFINETCTELGIVLLKPYLNKRTPLVYECSCGAIGSTRLQHLLLGTRCGHCVEMKWRAYFLNFGCEIITYVSSAKVIYQCSCGGVANVKAGHFKTGDKKCPKCRVNWNTGYVSPLSRRPALYFWKQGVLTRDDFECQVCKVDYDLQVHHIEAYSIRPDLADEIANGITVCYACHKFLHRKYGHNVGRRNLLNECSVSKEIPNVVSYD